MRPSPVAAAVDDQEGEAPPPANDAAATLRLSVSEAIQIALANSFAVELAVLNRTIQERQVIIEEAVYDPVLTAASDYGKNRQPTTSVLDVGGVALGGEVINNPFETRAYSVALNGRNLVGTQYVIQLRQSQLDQPAAEGSVFGFNPQDSVSASFEITQPLLQGGWRAYNTGRIRIASNNKEISQHDLELAAADFIYEVEVAYWQLAFALKNYESKEKALQTATENLGIVEESNRIGVSSDSDVLVARSQEALRKVEFNEAQVLLFNSRDQLLVLMNQEGMESMKRHWGARVRPFDHVWVIPTAEPSTEPWVPKRTEALEAAFAHRGDYKRINLELKNQDIQVELASNETLPRLDARGRWEQLGLDEGFSDSFSSLGDGRFYNWSVGIELSFPLGNRAQKNRYYQAKDQVAELKFRRAQLENGIVAQIDQSIRNLVSLFERINDLEARVRLQRELLEKEQEKLGVGRTVDYNISVIENDLIDSEALALRAKVEYEVAKTDYLRVTGRLLETRVGRAKLRPGDGPLGRAVGCHTTMRYYSTGPMG